MANQLKTGDKVAWRSSGGGSVGRVERKLTSPGKIKGHEVAASENNPEFGRSQPFGVEEGQMNPGLIPPADVAAAAKKGLELREKFNRGGTSVGVQRAKQLAERRDVTFRDITAISAYFARHEVDKASKSHEWGDETDPSASYIAWLLWGGEPGRRWADSLTARLNKTAAE
jgi:Hypervirulence associated proteins TUDOR domain